MALGSRPSACKANRPASGRGQGRQPPKAGARSASLEPWPTAGLLLHSCFLALLARISGEGWSQMIGQVRLSNELVEFFTLAVGKRVHWINDDGTGPRFFSSCASSDRRVDDRNKKA